MPAMVYVLYSETWDQFYIGSTNDITRRLAEHNAGKTPSTRGGRPWTVQFQYRVNDLKAARAKERYLKSLKSRKILMRLLAGDQTAIQQYLGD